MTEAPVAPKELAFKKNQAQILMDDHRFILVVCGRRFGKTTTLATKMFRNGCAKPGLHGYFAPTYKQAKLIAWNIFKTIVPRHYLAGRPNESELKLTLKNGAVLQLFGMDNAENLYGIKLQSGVCDEYDQMKKDAVDNVLRPAVSDTKGQLYFSGTPDATRGLLKDLSEQLKMDKKAGKRPEWNSYHFKSVDGGYIDKEEIEAAREELDERTFRQQYEATFETAEGKVYYAFSFDDNVQQSAIYDPRLPIAVCWDFNVDPFCLSLAQTHPGKNGIADVKVFDEQVIRNSNTPEMCRELIRKFPNHKAKWLIYGDATGKSRHTNSSVSDYQIIFDAFKNMPGGAELRVKMANPDVKDRLAAVNSKLRTYEGKYHLFVNPKCKWLIKDLMDVVRKPGTNEIDKSNPDRTHSTDGLGYFVEYEFPVVKGYLS